MKKEKLFNYGKKLTASLLATAIAVSTISILPSFAKEEQQINLDKIYSTGCILDSKSTIEEHAASDEEVYGIDIPDTTNSETHDALVNVFKAGKIVGLPSKVDLSSEFPKVGNQGVQGSCSAWATTYYMKSYQEAIEHGWDASDEKHSFSPAYVYNQLDQGRGHGTSISSNLNLLVREGACSLYNMKYNALDSATQPNQSQVDMASNFKGAEVDRNDNSGWKTLKNIDMLKQGLADGYAVVVGVDVHKDFDEISKTNPVFDKFDRKAMSYDKWFDLDISQRSGTDYNRGGHSICLVGYENNFTANGKTQDVFKFINSWGSDWGLNGYGYVSADLLANMYDTGIQAYVLEDTHHDDNHKFFTEKPNYVEVINPIRAYSSPDYFEASTDKDNYVKTIPVGTVINISRFVGSENGQQPYFVTEDGYYINAQKDSLIEAVIEDNFINGDKNNSVYNYNNSETSKITITPNSNEKFNNHNTLKIEYTVNQSDSYNGYAGAKIDADQNVSTSKAKGISFKYMTPAGQNGTIALCLQGSVSKKLVELPTTNGKWVSFCSPYDFNSSNLSDIEIYINGNESNCKTSPANGVVYLAELSTTYDTNNTYLLNFSGDEGIEFSGAVAGAYKKGTALTIKAIPGNNYNFVGWSKEKGGEIISTNASYDVFMTDNVTLYANAKKNNTHNFKIIRDVEGGIIYGDPDGEYKIGSMVSGYAKAKDGYRFIGWSTSEDGPIVSTDSVYYVKLNEDITLYPHFEKGEVVITKTVKTATNYYQYGNVRIEGDVSPTYNSMITVPINSHLIITAEPSDGFYFAGWYLDNTYSGTPFSTDIIINVDITDNMEFYAKFEREDTTQYQFTVDQNEGGSLYGNKTGKYYKNEFIRVQASAQEYNGYEFIGWSEYEGGEIISTESEYSFRITKDTTLFANFNKIPYCHINIPKSKGCASIDGTLGKDVHSKDVRQGTDVTVTATGLPGYKFVGWYFNPALLGRPASTDPTITISTTGKNEVFAVPYFVEAEDSVELTVVTNEGCSVTGDIDPIGKRNFSPGTTVSLNAKMDDGYRLVGWSTSEDGPIISKSGNYTFTITENTTLYLRAEKIPDYELRIVKTEGCASILGDLGTAISEVYREGSNVTVYTRAMDGYKFDGWYNNEKFEGSPLSTETNYSFVINENIVLYPKFTKIEIKEDDSNILIKGISNSISDWTNANGGSYLNITSGSSDYLFNGAKTLKLDYNINTNDQYGGYAGRTVSLESTYKNDSSKGYNGIGFWYMTPADFNGQIALCLQSNNIGLDDLVQLSSTNGEWKYYFYQTDKTNLSDMTLYINGSKNGYTTTASNGVAKGTLYMANIEVAKK